MSRLLLIVLYGLQALVDTVIPNRAPAVLAYHSISDADTDTAVKPGIFAAQLDALMKAGYVFVPLSDVVAWYKGKKKLSRKSLALTFDDGYADFAAVVMPLLRGRSIPAALFVVGDLAVYGERMSTPMLSGDQLKALRGEALVEFGYHTKSHPDLRTVKGKELMDECAAPSSMRWFAYPGGNYSEEAVDAVRSLGYEVAFSIKPEPVCRSNNPYLLPRIVVTRGMPLWELCARTGRAGKWYRTLRRLFRHG